jgi:hypothetical protein
MLRNRDWSFDFVSLKMCYSQDMHVQQFIMTQVGIDQQYIQSLHTAFRLHSHFHYILYHQLLNSCTSEGNSSRGGLWKFDILLGVEYGLLILLLKHGTYVCL